MSRWLDRANGLPHMPATPLQRSPTSSPEEVSHARASCRLVFHRTIHATRNVSRVETGLIWLHVVSDALMPSRISQFLSPSSISAQAHRSGVSMDVLLFACSSWPAEPPSLCCLGHVVSGLCVAGIGQGRDARVGSKRRALMA